MSFDVLEWRRDTAALYAQARHADTPERGHARWIAGRQQLFAEHPASANHDVRLRYGQYDPAMRFHVEIVMDDTPERIDIPTGTDGVVAFSRLGHVDLPDVGRLDIWWLSSYGGGIWVPVRDPSPHTYGGGRYVIDTVKGADLGGHNGSLIVDLNFAYNPSCAYDEAWACPLAPPGNVIDTPLAVGELLPT